MTPVPAPRRARSTPGVVIGPDRWTTGRRQRVPRRVFRPRRRVRTAALDLLAATLGLTLGLVLPLVRAGPVVDGRLLADMLISVGFGVLGVVTIVFSLLFGVVQWSAASFSPRLALFRDDPLVWGTFALAVGVFVYSFTAGLTSGVVDHVSLLVPGVAVLAILATFVLIRALNRRAFLALQLAQVLALVGVRGHEVVADLYPSEAGPASARPPDPLPDGPLRTVDWSGASGVVQQLDVERLVLEARKADAVVVLRVGVGDPVYTGSPLADLHRGELPAQVVRGAVLPGVERTFHQDPMLAFRLLADIALRALSPAVNDPGTAVDVLAAIEGLLRDLVTRDLRVHDVVDDRGVLRVRLVLPTWEEYLRTAVEDLLPVAAPVPMVLERVRRLLGDLLELSPPAHRAELARLLGKVETRLAAA